MIYSCNKGIKTEPAVEFLGQLWLYSSTNADCHSIVVIDESVEYKHFCLSE
ncbi:MAG: hypothetical protein QXJ97_07205 [Desulfurococcaceae archaeon]